MEESAEDRERRHAHNLGKSPAASRQMTQQQQLWFQQQQYHAMSGTRPLKPDPVRAMTQNFGFEYCVSHASPEVQVLIAV